MNYLIDSDWVIDYLVGDAMAQTLLAQLRPDGIAISIVTFIEVYEGIYGSRDPKHGERVFRAFLAGTPVLSVTRKVAKRNGQIRDDLRRRGRQINHRALDLLIAATALTYDLTLVTRNRRHYSDITGPKLY